MSAACLRIDQEVDVREEGGFVVIEPIVAPNYDLDDLLSRITPETFPEDIDFGAPVGREAW
jgi:antitoxin MazE